MRCLWPRWYGGHGWVGPENPGKLFPFVLFWVLKGSCLFSWPCWVWFLCCSFVVCLLLNMGGAVSIPSESPLGRITAEWPAYSYKPMSKRKMGNESAIPSYTCSLGCILQNWVIFSMLLEREVFFFFNTAWPQCSLDSGEKLPRWSFFMPKLFLFAYAVRESWFDNILFFQNSDPVRTKICLAESSRWTLTCPWNINAAHFAWDLSLGLISRTVAEISASLCTDAEQKVGARDFGGR